MKICTNCNLDNSIDSHYCFNCGENIEAVNIQKNYHKNDSDFQAPKEGE